MTKTFCDECGREMPKTSEPHRYEIKRGDTKFVFDITASRQVVKANTWTSGGMDVCGVCVFRIIQAEPQEERKA